MYVMLIYMVQSLTLLISQRRVFCIFVFMWLFAVGPRIGQILIISYVSDRPLQYMVYDSNQG